MIWGGWRNDTILPPIPPVAKQYVDRIDEVGVVGGGTPLWVSESWIIGTNFGRPFRIHTNTVQIELRYE